MLGGLMLGGGPILGGRRGPTLSTLADCAASPISKAGMTASHASRHAKVSLERPSKDLCAGRLE
jgi:hypothetical protein